MTTVIDDFRKVRFARDLAHQAQQQTSILSGFVDREELSGHKIFLDDYGSITMQKTVGRAPDTPTGTVPRNRRMMFREEFVFSELLHRNDRLDFDGMVEPNSKYRMTFSMAVQRQIDQSIIDAAFADAFSGETGSTTVTFASEGTTVGGSTQDLTNTLAQTIAQNFDNLNVPEEGRVLVIDPISWRKLLTEALAGPHIGSVDYNNDKPSVDHGGRTMQWAGMTVVKSTLLATYDTTVAKNCIAFQRDGLVLGIANEGRWEVDTRADKSHATQTAMYLDIGCTRRFGTHVQKVVLDIA